MRAYHFLMDDFRAGEGNEPAWTIGETRTIPDPENIKLCKYGYHSSPSWYDALSYAPGNMACVVEVSEPVARDSDKQVSATRRLIAARNVERELRLWGCDCAERALLREREVGREPDKRCWGAIAVARRYADDEATKGELDAAWDAARDAAGTAARAAARDAAWDAAKAAEIAWQRQHLQEMLDAVFAAEAQMREET